ncbi:MAG: hypothetical protein KC415_22950 [Anaerolineales bacterium]|nr:hypothetical protein [Anaerolineales bacterium]MCB8991827.1 hypothetical protein [Ardenticatenaceae bacterium]
MNRAMKLVVKQIGEERRQLEDLIAQRCLAFSQATGLTVERVEIGYRFAGEPVQYDVTVVVSLPGNGSH